jgi:hypothetical protein
VTRSAVFSKGSSGSASGSNTNGSSANQIGNTNNIRPGLNPTLRGYSPSKLRWKLQHQQNGVSGPSNNPSGLSYPGPSSSSMNSAGASTSVNGIANPNAYTRSTKHVPSAFK